MAADARNLPDIYTMRDGRKSKKIPLANFTTASTSATWLAQRRSVHASVFPVTYPAAALRNVQALVDEYHDRVLNDYHSLGMLVRFETGRIS